MKPLEFNEFIALLMLFSSFIRVVRAGKLFWQHRKKYTVFSVSRVHEHNEFPILAKLCLTYVHVNDLNDVNIHPNVIY